MRRGPSRHRLGLIAVFAGLTLLFVWDNVHGQSFRPRNPAMPGMPNIPRPPVGGAFGGETGYKCDKCGKVMVAKSGSILDKPSSCPNCGVRFINGGLGGTGNPSGGNPTNPPVGGNPAVPPDELQPQPAGPATVRAAPTTGRPVPAADVAASSDLGRRHEFLDLDDGRGPVRRVEVAHPRHHRDRRTGAARRRRRVDDDRQHEQGRTRPAPVEDALAPAAGR